MCVVFQEQLSHPYLPILGSHMERGKSFLRRNTGHQDPWEPMPQKEGTGRMLPVLTSIGMPMRQKNLNILVPARGYKPP